MTNLLANIARYQNLPQRLCAKHPGIRICSLLITVFVAIVLPVTGYTDSIPELTIQVGVRDDAKPFSYVDTTRDSESILPGFSGYSIEVCRYVLKQMQTLPRYQNYKFTAVKIKARTRFKHLGTAGKVFMLCGPDSISATRLVDFRSSHAVFLTGMTYAYINPRSPKFPRGNYCEHVVGVVRGTTADTEGLEDLASRNILMRFDDALDLEVHKKPRRVEKSLNALQEITNKVLDDAQKEITELTELGERGGSDSLDATTKGEERRLRLIDHAEKIRSRLNDAELSDWNNALAKLESEGIGLAAKIRDLMPKEYQKINAQIAREIITDECPQGFTSMPVRKFEDHERGIDAFCRGDVLYYLADFDILKNKTQEIAGCDIVMNRFTRSREVYGVYFPKTDTFDTDPDSDSEPLINTSSFYADFNHFLLLAMQGEQSKLEDLFEKEFGVQKKSEELERFFDGFKFSTP